MHPNLWNPRGPPKDRLAAHRRARVLAQKSAVPVMPTSWTITVFSTIDLAVAVPTPTGPPLAV